MSEKFRFNCLKVSAVLSFMLFFQLSIAQPAFPEIDKKVEAAKKELGGYAVALIYKDGKIIYQKTIGADFNAKTQVPIGNASQWLTAALVMSFVDQGKISLDDKVSKYLPVFSKYSKGFITIKDCLAHLTGLESEPIRLVNLFGRKKYTSLEEEVDEFAAKKEIISNPGLEFRYSNIGMNIAGRILEVVSKRGFEQLMREKITGPLMMRNTSFTSLSAVNPSSGAVSTASDYVNFLAMMLNKGMFNGKQVLSAKAVADMQTIRTTPAMMKYSPKPTEGYSYGLGNWVLEADENGIGTVVASPGMAGSWPLIDRCRGYALVVLTKGDLGEEKKEIWMSIKGMIDEKIPAVCK